MRTFLRIFSHPQLTLVHYTTHHGPHLPRHPVPHKDHIHSRYLDKQFPDTTNGRGTYGRTQTHEGGTWILMTQGIPWGESHPHALHAQHMVVEHYGRTRTLLHPDGGICTDYGDDQQHHEFRLQLCQYQAQETPWNFLRNCTHRTTNWMDILKVSLE